MNLGYFLFFFLALPALFSAIATACFCGRPAFISARIFLEMVFLDFPGLSGIVHTPNLNYAG